MKLFIWPLICLTEFAFSYEIDVYRRKFNSDLKKIRKAKIYSFPFDTQKSMFKPFSYDEKRFLTSADRTPNLAPPKVIVGNDAAVIYEPPKARIYQLLKKALTIRQRNRRQSGDTMNSALRYLPRIRYPNSSLKYRWFSPPGQIENQDDADFSMRIDSFY